MSFVEKKTQAEESSGIHQISEAARIEANELLADGQALEAAAAKLRLQRDQLNELSDELYAEAGAKRDKVRRLLYGKLRSY